VNKKLQVEIFGTHYTLQGNADAAYTQSLAAFVHQKMVDLAGKTQELPLSKLAVLTAINISHELFQLRNQQVTQRDFIDGKTRDLISNIEDQFEELRFDK